MSAPGRKPCQQTARAVFYFRMHSASRGLQGAGTTQCDKGLRPEGSNASVWPRVGECGVKGYVLVVA